MSAPTASERMEHSPSWAYRPASSGRSVDIEFWRQFRRHYISAT